MISLKETALNKFFREIYLNSDEDMRSARSNHFAFNRLERYRDHRSRRCGGGRHSVYAGNSGGAETRRS
uniref:Uncharacterized protein n=1 Tax=Brassica campestris TaxID=3711 RepID=M4FHA9_BRACM|nr:unnamed protein product [Brassica rapa]